MSSQFRPLIAGLAAVTVCVLLASMNWLLVLYAFVIASLGFAALSWRRQAGNGERAEKLEFNQRPLRRNRERSSARRRRALRNGNVYQYPFRNYSDDPDLSEVVDRK